MATLVEPVSGQGPIPNQTQLENSLWKKTMSKIGMVCGNAIEGIVYGGTFSLIATRIVSEITNLKRIEGMALTEELCKTPISLTVFAGPLVEELFFRGLIQNILLKHIPKAILKKMQIDESWIDTKAAQLARIILTSTVFATGHLTNRSDFGEEYANSQVIQAFVSGIIMGIVAETFDLEGSIGLHMARNALAAITLKIACEQQYPWNA